MHIIVFHITNQISFCIPKQVEKGQSPSRKLPVTETQWAQPAAALTIDASVGRGKGSGVSLNDAINKVRIQLKESRIANQKSRKITALPHAFPKPHNFDLHHLPSPMLSTSPALVPRICFSKTKKSHHYIKEMVSTI